MSTSLSFFEDLEKNKTYDTANETAGKLQSWIAKQREIRQKSLPDTELRKRKKNISSQGEDGTNTLLLETSEDIGFPSALAARLDTFQSQYNNAKSEDKDTIKNQYIDFLLVIMACLDSQRPHSKITTYLGESRATPKYYMPIGYEAPTPSTQDKIRDGVKFIPCAVIAIAAIVTAPFSWPAALGIGLGALVVGLITAVINSSKPIDPRPSKEQDKIVFEHAYRFNHSGEKLGKAYISMEDSGDTEYLVGMENKRK